MSLYNMVFGMNPYADMILSALGLQRADFGRFRDAFVAAGEIAVYTRNGGGNRAGYQHIFDRMRQHPLYLRDQDDSFDSTFATFYFRIPAGFERLSMLDIGKFDPDQRWHDKLNEIKQPGYKPSEAQMRAMEDLVKQINEAKSGDVVLIHPPDEPKEE